MIERSPGRDPKTDGEGRSAASTEEAVLSARLARLGESLEAKREPEAQAKGGASGFAQATKIASEFVAGVVVGGGLGWAIDRALGSSPWGLIVFLLLGFAAGVLNVLRAEGLVADAGARLREAGNSGPPSDPPTSGLGPTA